MKNWWHQRQPRERQILIAAMGIIILIIVFLLVWEPWYKQRHQLQNQTAKLQADLIWMQQASQQFANQQSTQKILSQSLLATVDKTARRAKLNQFIKRLEPDGERQVRIWFEQANFDVLVAWMGQLKQIGIEVSTITIKRQAQNGLVNVRLVLVGGA